MFQKSPRVKQNCLPAAVEALENRRMLAAHLLRDINVKPIDPYKGSPISPGRPFAFGNIALFAQANDEFENVELWRTDGTAAGTFLVKDINPGPLPSFPSGFVAFNGYAYFIAETGTTGTNLVSGLWRTDGTAGGTTQIQNLNPAGGVGTFTPTSVSFLTVAGSKMYFFTPDAGNGHDLWETDGTNAGTTLVSDVASVYGESIETAAYVGSKLYFDVWVPASNTGSIWVSDGTNAGTVSLTSTPPLMTPIYGMGSTAYYVDESRALWQTQGTAATTLSLGNAGSPYAATDTYSGSMTASGGSLYINDGVVFCYTPGAGAPAQLTYSGTALVDQPGLVASAGSVFLTASSNQYTDIFQATPTGLVPMIPPSQGATFTNLTAVGESLFFLEDGGELGSMQATPGAFVTLTGILNSGAPGAPQGFAAFGARLFFDNWDATHGWNIWSSDGTASGTALITDADLADLTSNPYYFFNFGNALLFSADDGVHGRELWITDGTTAGTTMVADLNPGSASGNPSDFDLVGTRVFFVATDSSGTQLWATDGSLAGTYRVSNIQNTVSGSANIRGLTAYGNEVYFSADSGNGAALWRSDGTAAGTVMVAPPGAAASFFNGPIGIAGGELIVINGNNLYASDGTSTGTSLILASGSWLGEFQTIGDYVYFSASDPAHGREVWRTDGTMAGTQLFADVNPGTADSNPAYGSGSDPNFISYNGRIYFQASGAGVGTELFSADGTGGATLVSDLLPGSGGSYPINMRVFNGKLYFLAKHIDTASNSDNVDQLWVTDGTAAGTSLVYQAPSDYQTSYLNVVGSQLYFYSYLAPYANPVLFQSDGTTAGTVPVAWENNNLRQPFVGGPITGLPNGNVIVAADDGVYGFEPWVFSVQSVLIANAGGPYTVNEGSQVPLSAAGSTDVGAKITSYEWDWTNYNGSTFVTNATGLNPTFSAVGLDGPSQVIAGLRVTDSLGNISLTKAIINISNVAPTASLSGSAVTVGSGGSVSFSNVTDPSPADIAAGFTYSYDFNNDGSFDLVSTRPSATVPASYLSVPGSYTIAAEVTDKDGGSTLYKAVVQVNVTASQKLTGTVIGTSGSYKNSGNTAARAFDGSLTTYFDGPNPSGDWVGLDLGSAKVITSLAYASRSGWASRMNGGIFQASNSSSFSSGVVNLYTVAANANPSSTVLTTQQISNSNGYRYVRYLGPANSYGDVSEVQFFGKAAVALTKFTGATIGTSGSYQNSGNTIAKATDGNLSTFFDGPIANGNWVGLDLGLAKTVKQISFAPRTGWASRMIGGIFQASNSANFSGGVVNLYTVSSAPPQNVLTTVSINVAAYRYVRYLSPNGSYGDIAEVQFFG